MLLTWFVYLIIHSIQTHPHLLLIFNFHSSFSLIFTQKSKCVRWAPFRANWKQTRGRPTKFALLLSKKRIKWAVKKENRWNQCRLLTVRRSSLTHLWHDIFVWIYVIFRNSKTLRQWFFKRFFERLVGENLNISTVLDDSRIPTDGELSKYKTC